MAEKGEKAQAGELGKCTVLQLKPVSYQIKLHYMGHDRIKHYKTKYRCKYELLKEASVAAPGVGATRADPATSDVAPPAVIPNVVREVDPSDAKAKPALPSFDKGDSSNPDPDEIFRIVISDNHAVSKVDLNAVFGGTLSKPGSYKNRKWMPDISPAVPFRVVIKKFIGDDEVPMTDELELIIEIKDSKEEFDQNNGKRREFLEGFFNKYNRTDTDPDPGDDNALKKFSGIRAPSAKDAGVKATNVIKKAPYVKPPVAGEGPGNPNTVKFLGLSAASALGKHEALLSIKSRKDGDNEVGVADFIFMPSTVGGDNYRFLLSVRKAGKSDIRQQTINGAKVKLLDDDKKEIKPKCCYTTGRFVIWRRIQFRMLVLCNGMVDDIAYDSIATTYRKSFVMLDSPANTFTADWKVWRDALKDRYAGNPSTDAWFDDANEANLKLAYARGLIPGTTTTGDKFKFDKDDLGESDEYTFDLDPDVHAITRYLIKRACIDPPTKRTNPDGNDQVSYDKDDSDGLFILYAKRKSPDTDDSTLGEYIGDRIFYMYKSASADDTTDTCSHELGHALYLSHSLTHSYTYRWNAVGGTRVRIMEATSNCAIHDHDQNDAATCLMGYISSSYLEKYPYDPCGACSLVLRFFNKLEVQKERHFGKQMMKDLKPAKIVLLKRTTKVLKEAIPDVAVGSRIRLVAVGKEVDWPKTGGTWKARVGLSGLANFTATGVGGSPGSVTIHKRTHKELVYRSIEGKTVGRVRISFNYYGVEASAEINVRA